MLIYIYIYIYINIYIVYYFEWCTAIMQCVIFAFEMWIILDSVSSWDFVLIYYFIYFLCMLLNVHVFKHANL